MRQNFKQSECNTAKLFYWYLAMQHMKFLAASSKNIPSLQYAYVHSSTVTIFSYVRLYVATYVAIYLLYVVAYVCSYVTAIHANLLKISNSKFLASYVVL